MKYVLDHERNICVEMKMEVPLTPELESTLSSPTANVHEELEAEDVLNCFLETLEPPMRKILKLKKNNIPVSKIAKEFDVTPKTIHRRIKRAKLLYFKFKKCL